MASVACPSSPNSFRLRFGHRCKGSSSVFFKLRFRPSTRRVRLISANGGGGESWTSSNPDSLAGWSGSESGDGGDPENNNKNRFGGMLGAGLAGIFFTAGLTFAALSLRGRSTTGTKQHMKLLSSEQEVIFTSDDQISNPDQADLVIPDKQIKIDDCNSDLQTGINEDPPPHTEIIEGSTGNAIHHSDTALVENLKQDNFGVGIIHSLSCQEDLQIGLNVDVIPVPSLSNPVSPEFSTNEDIDLSTISSSSKDSHDNVFSGSPDQTIQHNANQSNANHVDHVSLSFDSTDHVSDHQQGNLTPVDIPSDFSSQLENELQSKPSASSFIVLESGDVVVPQDNIRDSAALVSKEDDVEHSDELQLPSGFSTLDPVVDDIIKTIPSGKTFGSKFVQNVAISFPEESTNSTDQGILGENTLSATHSAALADANGNESDISSHSQLGRFSKFGSEPVKLISYAGIPAPSLVSAALQVPPGKVLVPAVVDPVQGQAFTALQVLKVIEADVQPGDLCTRREYARWLVSASSALSRHTISKVYPAMYIENITELAFDDVTPEDPDYSCIQGLAEAGMISSKLSKFDLIGTSAGHKDSFFFCPESPVSRQDLVSWKMALERRQLPLVDETSLYQCSGYIDIDRIDKDVWPALVADLSAGEQGITALTFGYTRLFQPNKPVTKAQVAIALATGDAAEVVGEELTRIEAESLAETAVNAHTALVAQVEKELNARFEAELAKEKEKIDSLEKMAEEARLELEKLKAEKAEENNALIRGRAAVESEMEFLSKLRHEVEEQLQDVLSNKMEVSFERDRINRLRKEAESENQAIVQLQYELEVERKALSMARSWAEEEAKRAREQARALKEARDRWERHGIKVFVDEDLQEDASTGVTWLTAGKQPPADETVNRAENLVEKLKTMSAEMKTKSSAIIQRIIQKIVSLISVLKSRACHAFQHAKDLQSSVLSKASRSIEELKENASGFSSTIGERARRAAEDCKEGVEKFTHKFKSQ